MVNTMTKAEIRIEIQRLEDIQTMCVYNDKLYDVMSETIKEFKKELHKENPAALKILNITI